MPARITDTPRAIPLKLLIVELRLGKPQHEIRLVPFIGILTHIIALA